MVFKFLEFVLRSMLSYIPRKYLPTGLFGKRKNFEDSLSLSEVYRELDKVPLKENDIVLVHASWSYFLNGEVSPIDVICYLQKKVGVNGGIVMPAFIPRINDVYEGNSTSVVYNPDSRSTSSGMLAATFLRMKGVKRSHFPYNSLAAWGNKVDAIFNEEINSTLAHDEFSAWQYCMEKSAKIIFLGVESRNTTTMVHVAEELEDFHWPVEDWWVRRSVIMNIKGTVVDREFKIRNPKFSKRNLSLSRTIFLRSKGILVDWKVKGVPFGYIDDSHKLIKVIVEEAKTGNLFWWV